MRVSTSHSRTVPGNTTTKVRERRSESWRLGFGGQFLNLALDLGVLGTLESWGEGRMPSGRSFRRPTIVRRYHIKNIMLSFPQADLSLK